MHYFRFSIPKGGIQAKLLGSSTQFPSFLPVGHPTGLDGFVGCIDLTYLRDSLTNIRIRVLSQGRPSFRENASYYYFFRGGVHISLFCPPSTCVCMCAVNAGGCVIDLFVQGWASTSSLLCLVTGNSANTDNSPVPTSPFCIPPYQAWRVAGGRWKITSDTLTLLPTNRPDRGSNPGRQCDRRDFVCITVGVPYQKEEFTRSY